MTSRAYYNEFDPHAAAWLRELIKEGHIAPGDVDERSIKEVSPHDLDGYTQHHFFAGIGGWSYALRLAGWPDERPVCTASCPCQPFSGAGLQRAEADERHLWPDFARLALARKFPVIFGEQVASALGRQWLAGVFADLEGMGYQRAGADLCAAGVGAPHIRQRLYWMAYADDSGSQGRGRTELRECADERVTRESGDAGGLGDSAGERSLPGALAGVRGGEESRGARDGESERSGGSCGVADAQGGRLGRSAAAAESARRSIPPADGYWSAFDLIPCSDGKQRRVESGTFPLAHGVSGRVGLLRGYGNAIVPPLAAEFIGAFLDLVND